MDQHGSLYVSDYKKNEVRRWKRRGEKETLIPRGNEKGDGFIQLNRPTYIFVDENNSLFVSDTENHRVMISIKGAEEGVIVVDENGREVV